ncbi:MAG: energy transducer TonB, partial [Rhodocyclales bacterium]|nr:energy transducer TonB [Rhodocyclales bacterium]
LLPYAGARHPIGNSFIHTPKATPRTFAATLATARPDGAQDVPARNASAASTLHPLAIERDPESPPSQHSEGANLIPLPAPAYYTSDRLTKRPQAQYVAELDTLETQSVIASGKIVLQLWINDQGSAVNVLVEKSDLPDVFTNAAVAAFRQSRFLPGELNGRRVGSIMRIEVSYDDGRSPAQ